MLGRGVLPLVMGLLLLLFVVQVACANQNILINKDYQMVGKNIVVHIIEVNITSYQMMNVAPPPDPESMKFVHLVYTFENIGDTRATGFIKPIFIASAGDRYQNTFDYTSEAVLPYTTAGPFFVEIPVPKNVTLVAFICREGFDDHYFEIPKATPTPTPGPGTPVPPVASLAGTPNDNVASCLPLVPIAMAGGIAALGVVVNQNGIRKR